MTLGVVIDVVATATDASPQLLLSIPAELTTAVTYLLFLSYGTSDVKPFHERQRLGDWLEMPPQFDYFALRRPLRRPGYRLGRICLGSGSAVTAIC